MKAFGVFYKAIIVNTENLFAHTILFIVKNEVFQLKRNKATDSLNFVNFFLTLFSDIFIAIT